MTYSKSSTREDFFKIKQEAIKRTLNRLVRFKFRRRREQRREREGREASSRKEERERESECVRVRERESVCVVREELKECEKSVSVVWRSVKETAWW